jgi:hypothetical protein
MFKKLNQIYHRYRISRILKYHGIKNYTINDDLSVDVDGDVVFWRGNLKKLPVQFGIVTGKFSASNFGLETLKGFPKHVGTYLFINRNKLTSLEHIPAYVGMSISCKNNNIKELDYLPLNYEGMIICDIFVDEIDDSIRLLREFEGEKTLYGLKEYSNRLNTQLNRSRLIKNILNV